MKLDNIRKEVEEESPAAFRRLCVETFPLSNLFNAFRQPPSGGCVLKHAVQTAKLFVVTSRLQAAVC